MKCHITDIIAHTTAAMGMAPTPPPILPDVCHCATDISKMIKMKLLEVATEAVLKADAVMLAPGVPVRSLLAWPEGHVGHGMAVLPLPDDCLRLIDVKLSDWKRPATIISQDSPEYMLQTSPFEGVRGNPENPVAAICQRPTGLVAELYSSRGGRGVAIDTAQYVPMPLFSREGFIFLPEKLYHNIISATATLTAQALQ